jgi:hypothetical protein
MQEIFTRLYILFVMNIEYYRVTQLEISSVIVPRMSVSKEISDFNIQGVLHAACRRNCTSSQTLQENIFLDEFG